MGPCCLKAFELNGRTRQECAYHSTQAVAFAGSLWHQSVFNRPHQAFIQPYVPNIEYVGESYRDFRGTILRPNNQHCYSIEKNRPQQNTHEHMTYLMNECEASYVLNAKVPYIIGTRSDIFVFDEDKAIILDVSVAIGTEKDGVSIDPIVFLPEKPSVYSITFECSKLHYTYNWQIDSTRRQGKEMLTIPLSKIPVVPFLFCEVDFTISVALYER